MARTAGSDRLLLARKRPFGKRLTAYLSSSKTLKKHRLINYVEMFRATLYGTSVYPREVVKEALKLNAAAVIFPHIIRAAIQRRARRTGY